MILINSNAPFTLEKFKSRDCPCAHGPVPRFTSKNDLHKIEHVLCCQKEKSPVWNKPNEIYCCVHKICVIIQDTVVREAFVHSKQLTYLKSRFCAIHCSSTVTISSFWHCVCPDVMSVVSIPHSLSHSLSQVWHLSSILTATCLSAEMPIIVCYRQRRIVTDNSSLS